MDVFKQLETFVSVVNLGSLSAAARQEDVVPAIIGRRLDALEHRLGAKLLVRTTRSISLTQEGSAFYEDCQRILGELSEAESAVASGSARARGHLRLSAPAGFRSPSRGTARGQLSCASIPISASRWTCPTA